MNKNLMILVGGAFVVAILMAVIVQMMMGKEPEPVQVAEVPKLEILVAANDLGVGHELGQGDVTWQEWPEEHMIPGAIKRKEGQLAHDAVKGRLGRDLAEGEPILKSALIKAGKANFVAASLKKGMRAVAIEVSASSMVGGFIGPGDYVDIILTYRESIRTKDDDPRVQSLIDLNLDKMATETILQNIRVLAIDQTAQRPDADKIKVGKTVTLEVNAEMAERLALAQEMGDLVLALRGIGDDELVEKKWQTISDARLTKVDDEIFDEYKKLKKDTGINPDIVRIYNGAQVQVISTQ